MIILDAIQSIIIDIAAKHEYTCEYEEDDLIYLQNSVGSGFNVIFCGSRLILAFHDKDYDLNIDLCEPNCLEVFDRYFCEIRGVMRLI